MAAAEIDIRLFGALGVRRADGTEVDPREWRTGKTADLVRLLAVNAGSVLSTDTLLSALWPDVERVKGAASLRTAVCQIHRVLQQDWIVRHHNGLSAGPARIDTGTFVALVALGRRLSAQHSWTEVIAAAHDAEALYVDDLSASCAGLPLLDEPRRFLRDLRVQLLLDAADAAGRSACWIDGIKCARTAVRLDAFCERGYRALMRSLVGAGETYEALKAYETCRTTLADELGVEPDPQTVAVYRELLLSRPQPGIAGEARRRLGLLELTAELATATGHHREAIEARRVAQAFAHRHGIARSELSAARPFRIGDLVRELNR